MSKSLGRMVKVERTIDKDSDSYHEKVTDPATGTVLNECKERLSDHINHGSAKLKKQHKSD